MGGQIGLELAGGTDNRDGAAIVGDGCDLLADMGPIQVGLTGAGFGGLEGKHGSDGVMVALSAFVGDRLDGAIDGSHEGGAWDLAGLGGLGYLLALAQEGEAVGEGLFTGDLGAIGEGEPDDGVVVFEQLSAGFAQGFSHGGEIDGGG